MQRVLIIGCCGAGKSTLARRLGERTATEVIHLDQHYWNAGWRTSAETVWRERVARLVARPSWIMDGNYQGTFDLRLPCADTVVFLDYPTHRCLWRVLKRIFRFRGRNRPDMAAGCPERLDWDFLHYVATFNLTRRPRLLRSMKNLRKGQKLVVLKNDRAVTNWLASVAPVEEEPVID